MKIEPKLSEAKAVAVTKLVVSAMKRRLKSTDAATHHALRQLTLDIIDDLYYESCSDTAQDRLRAKRAPGATSGKAVLLAAAGWE